jgi:hypothetical protein
MHISAAYRRSSSGSLAKLTARRRAPRPWSALGRQRLPSIGAGNEAGVTGLVHGPGRWETAPGKLARPGPSKPALPFDQWPLLFRFWLHHVMVVVMVVMMMMVMAGWDRLLLFHREGRNGEAK